MERKWDGKERNDLGEFFRYAMLLYPHLASFSVSFSEREKWLWIGTGRIPLPDGWLTGDRLIDWKIKEVCRFATTLKSRTHPSSSSDETDENHHHNSNNPSTSC